MPKRSSVAFVLALMIQKRIWSSTSRLFALLLLTSSFGLSTTACAPFAAEDESCEDKPCAAGLQCFESVCVRPTTPQEPESDCVEDDDCSLNGSADGRECEEGECVYTECVIDAQCGTRICEDGQCADAFPCSDDDDCREGQACQDSVCRAPCENDDDCAALPFNVCREGRCLQQCLGDFTCFGDICEDGVCLTPECDVDDDCEGDAVACEDNRCTSFTPCENDDECFDADFLCNDLGRCEERPLCRTDDECGLSALCIQDHCRPATTCASDDACDDGDECVAGRCVSALECRSDEDCEGLEVCDEGTCGVRAIETSSAVVVATAHQSCRSQDGACTLVLFSGETAEIRSISLDDGGRPLSVQHSAASDDEAIVSVADAPAGRHVLTATGPGRATISVTPRGSGSTFDAVDVTVLPSFAEPLGVLVIDAASGAPIEGALVTVGSTAEATDPTGLARFAAIPAPVGESFVGAIASGYEGHVVVGMVPTGGIRIALRREGEVEQTEAAGIRAKVTSSGDELGPVGVGVFLPAVKRASEARIDRLFGQTFNGSVELPVLGEIPIPLRGGISLEASLPVVGAQNVKDTAYVEVEPISAAGLALEGRFEQAQLFDFVLGADDVGVVLNIAQVGESLDADAVALGDIESLPLIEDGNLDDGVADIDNDGDINELLPDWLAFDEVELSPTRTPRERVGLRATALPEQARARTLAIGGVALPAVGFLPLGLAAPTIGSPEGPGSQMRVVAPEGGLARGDRQVVVQALFDDAGLSSALFFRGRSFAPSIDLGGFISPPEGAFFVDGVPTAGDRLLVLPQVQNATTFEALVAVGEEQWTLVVNAASGGGRSVALPPMLLSAPSSVGEVRALRLDGVNTTLATTDPYRAGAGPFRTIEDRARAVATARP